MLLVCIYHMLLRDEPFNPELYTLDRVPGYNRKPKLSADDAVALLEKLGATVIMPEHISVTEEKPTG